MSIAAKAADLERLRLFRAQHPEVPIMLGITEPTAFVGFTRVRCPTLRELLDRLAELCGGNGG